MQFDRQSFEDQPYLYVEKTTPYETIAKAMEEAFGAVFSLIGAEGITPQSAPISVYLQMPSGPELTFHAGVFVSGPDAAKASGEVQSGILPAGDAVHTTHVGPYSDLNKSHGALWKYLEDSGISSEMPVWEIYVDDPGDVPPERLRTEIYRRVIG